jgi:hypothetical protein
MDGLIADGVRSADLMLTLGKRSNAVRSERAAMRRALERGALRLSDVIRERPGWARDQLPFDLLLHQRHYGEAKLADLNRRAVLAGINLALPLARASARTREWLCAELERGGR